VWIALALFVKASSEFAFVIFMATSNNAPMAIGTLGVDHPAVTMKAKLLIALAALTGLACGRKSNATPAGLIDAAATAWASEQALHARGMIQRHSGAGRGAYTLRSDGCLRVTYRPPGARIVLGSAARSNEGERGVVPSAGPICGVRGDEWIIDAAVETSWALFATDSEGNRP
jgi:hypothetical protein